MNHTTREDTDMHATTDTRIRHPPLPRLQLTHTPGFVFRVNDGANAGALTVFDSDLVQFNMSFSLDVFEDGTMSNGIQPCGVYWDDPTPDELADLASACDRLQQWLDDCAEVTQWATDHRRELSAMLTGTTPC